MIIPIFLVLYPSKKIFLYPRTLCDFFYFVVLLKYDIYLNTYCPPLQTAKSTDISVTQLPKTLDRVINKMNNVCTYTICFKPFNDYNPPNNAL